MSRVAFSRDSWTSLAAATFLLVAVGGIIWSGSTSSLAIAAIVLALGVGVVAVVPEAGLAAVLLALPTHYDLHPMPRGSFSLLEIAILVAAAGTGLHVVRHMPRRGLADLRLLLTPVQVVVPVALLVVATALAMLNVADPSHRAESLREVRTVIVEPLVFLATARIVLQRPRARVWSVSSFLAMGGVVGVHAIAQVVFQWGGVQAGAVLRATGPYPHPNNLSFLLERTLLITAAIVLARPRWWPVWVLGGAQVAGLALTYSRGALLGLVIGGAVLLLLRQMYRWVLALGLAGALTAAAGIVIAPDRLLDMGGSGSEPTRFAIWRSSIAMLRDHPIFGVGPDQFLYQYMRRYVEPMGWPERYTSHPHNLVLDAWLRLGVTGVAAFTSLGAGLAWWVRDRLRAVRGDMVALGAVAALVGSVAHGMVDNAFFLPDLATMTWFFIALIVSTRPGSGTGSGGGTEDEEGSGNESRAPVSLTGTALTPGVLALIGVMLALVALPPHWIFTVGLIVAGAVLTWIAAPVMVAVVAATVPIQESVLLPNIRGDLTFTQIAVFGLVIGWGLTFWRRPVWLDVITLGFVAVGGALVLSLIEMDDPGLWFGEAYRWGIAGLYFVIARSVVREWNAIALMLWGMVLATAATWIYGLWQVIAASGPEHMVRGGILRVFATFGTPNTLAAYVEFTIPLLLILFLLGLGRNFRDRIGARLWIAAGATSLPGLVILALTQSRGGMVGFAVAMLLVLWILPAKLRIGTIIAGTAFVGLVLLTPAGQSQFERFTRIFDEEAVRPASTYDYGTGRSSLWGAAINMAEDKPLTGVGAGEFDYHYREYTPTWVDRFPRGQAHNGWLQMAAQAGIPGAVAFTGWVVASLVSLLSAACRSAEPLAKALAIGALAVMVAFTVHSLVDYLNVLSLGLQLSAITAIGLNLAPLPSWRRKPVAPALTVDDAPAGVRTGTV
jgi:O-antigen ligase